LEQLTGLNPTTKTNLLHVANNDIKAYYRDMSWRTVNSPTNACFDLTDIRERSEEDWRRARRQFAYRMSLNANKMNKCLEKQVRHAQLEDNMDYEYVAMLPLANNIVSTEPIYAVPMKPSSGDMKSKPSQPIEIKNNGNNNSCCCPSTPTCVIM